MTDSTTPAVELIPLDRIAIPNPRERDKKIFQEIVDSISKVGLKQPITVTRANFESEPAEYVLVCGQGRMEAFAALGQKEIPAIVIAAAEEDRMLMGLVENVARRRRHREHVLAEVFKFDDVKACLFDEAFVRFEALEAPERPVLADGVDVLDVLGGGHRLDPHPVVHGEVPARPQGARYLCEEFAAALVVAGVLDVDHDVDAPGVDGPGFGDVGDSVFDSGCLARRCGRGFLLGKRNLARRAIKAEHVAAVLACEEAGGASDSAPSVDDEVVGLDPGWGGDDLDEPVECGRESGPVDVVARCCGVGCVPVPEVDVLVVVVLVEVFRVRGVMVDDARVVVVLGICAAGPAGCIQFGAICGSGVESIHGQGVRSEQGVLLHGSTESRGGGSRNLLGAFEAREILGGIREGPLGVGGVLGAAASMRPGCQRPGDRLGSALVCSSRRVRLRYGRRVSAPESPKWMCPSWWSWR